MKENQKPAEALCHNLEVISKNTLIKDCNEVPLVIFSKTGLEMPFISPDPSVPTTPLADRVSAAVTEYIEAHLVEKPAGNKRRHKLQPYSDEELKAAKEDFVNGWCVQHLGFWQMTGHHTRK